MKTVEQVIEQLKAEKNLNEDALTKFYKHNKKQKRLMKVLGGIFLILCITSIIRSDITTSLISLILLIYGFYCMYVPALKDVVKYINLYNNGQKTSGIINSYEKISWPKTVGPFVHSIKYSFNAYNKTHNSKGNYLHNYLEIDGKELSEGQEIGVLYEESKPENSCIYNKKLEKIFKLRKD